MTLIARIRWGLPAVLLPLPFGEAGRTLLAHYYNQNRARHGGSLDPDVEHLRAGP
jgi:hypothetical protein